MIASLVKSPGLFSVFWPIAIMQYFGWFPFILLFPSPSVFWYSPQRIDTKTGGLGNKRMSGDHPNYCIIEIGQNTKKSPEDLTRLAVTQTLVKNHQLMLM